MHLALTCNLLVALLKSNCRSLDFAQDGPDGWMLVLSPPPMPRPNCVMDGALQRSLAKQILRVAHLTNDESSAPSVRDEGFLVAHGGGCQLLGASHQEREWDENGGDSDHYPDDIDIGQQAGLDLGHAVDLRARVIDGVGCG